MFILAFVVVVGYQIYRRKTGGYDETSESSLVSQFTKGGKKLSDKAKNDLSEIERMMGELGGLSKTVEQMTGSVGGEAKRARKVR